MSTAAGATTTSVLVADPKLERLLTIGKEINGLLFKINAATEYLAKGDGPGDFEAVEIARNQLARDLSTDYAEARELLPSLDELIARLQSERRGLENVHLMNVGLARIEGLSRTEKQRQFADIAVSTEAKMREVENMIRALDELQADLGTARRLPHLCPRCSSAKLSYRLTPSDLGYSLYRCDECGHAWRITRFSIRSD